MKTLDITIRFKVKVDDIGDDEEVRRAVSNELQEMIDGDDIEFDIGDEEEGDQDETN